VADLCRRQCEIEGFLGKRGGCVVFVARGVRRVLAHCEIGSRALARNAIQSGQLSWHGGIGSIRWHGGSLPKVGRQTWRALYRWAGRPSPPPKSHPIRGYPGNGLSSRANDCLSRTRIPATKQAVVLALNSGVLSPGKVPRRYGKITHTELCRWAGVDPATLKPGLK
jgi:hypothetical protein